MSEKSNEFCRGCGMILAENSGFCSECGMECRVSPAPELPPPVVESPAAMPMVEMPSVPSSDEGAPWQAPESTENLVSPQADTSTQTTRPLTVITIPASESPHHATPASHVYEAPPRPLSAPIEEKDQSDCVHFRVAYNHGRKFVQGFESPISFIFCPLVDGMDDLCLEVRMDHRSIGKKQVDEFLNRNRNTNKITIPYRPSTQKGTVSFEIYMSYSLGKDQYHFKASQEHHVFSKEDPVQGGMPSVTFVNETHLTQNQGHAGGNATIHHGAPSSDLLKSLYRENPEEMIRRLDQEVAWDTLIFRRCKPFDIFGVSASIRRFIRGDTVHLRRGNDLLHMVAWDGRRELRMVRRGKEQSSCDIPVNQTSHPDAWKEISSCHLRVTVENGHICIRDGAPGKPSSYGTWVNKEKLMEKGNSRLHWDGPSTIWLSGALGAKYPPAAIWECTPFKATMGTAALYFQRGDGMGEHWLFIHSSIRLDNLKLGLPPITVCQQNERIYAQEENGHDDLFHDGQMLANWIIEEKDDRS